MIDVKTKGKYENILCPLCDLEEDTQRHLIECNALSKNEVLVSIPVYEDLFSNDTQKILTIGRIIKSKLDKRNKILNNPQNVDVAQVNQLCSAV